MIKSPRLRVFLALLFGIAGLAVLVSILQRRSGFYPTGTNELQKTGFSDTPSTNSFARSSGGSATPTPTDAPLAIRPQSGTPNGPLTISPENVQSPGPSAPTVGYVGTLKLIVPVAGVQPDQLRDTFADSRSEGRVHDAIDIPAPLGTPVFAAADGKIVKLFQSERGGMTIYELSVDEKLIFYYAHLQRYADGLTEGKFVRQGEVIAYVGDSGNAGAGNYHLHFSIAVVADPKRYWEGVNINPYPLLRK